ncbi:acylphosphatase [Pectinatus brassicae]|uniref:acylphosphatase n=1 Tax=Pectinatus brassicae TaxID=862415 RepID=A0A840UT41_9FIRM|nr:acylphosphatase [Pectinatus brassicae]MBB5335984.1 acylphosphatase [Pectinatus brassicae]
MSRYFAAAHGRVQGVGFRYFVQNTAKKYKLTGWVKNMSDGTVTMEVQGNQEQIDMLFNDIKKGNMFIKVKKMDINMINDCENEENFTIRY